MGLVSAIRHEEQHGDQFLTVHLCEKSQKKAWWLLDYDSASG